MANLMRGSFVVALLVLVALWARGDDEEETKLALADCPPSVQKTLKREAAGGEVDEVMRYVAEGKKLYAAAVTVDGEDYQMLVTDEGLLVQKMIDDGADHTESEAELDLEDCPLAIQKSLLREAGDSEIDVVVERTANGETLYLTDVTLDDREYLVIIDAEGRLVSKTLYDEDEEKAKDPDAVKI
jgi:uncharacterized membrane protein YkoI